jgi:hypothetical protein
MTEVVQRCRRVGRDRWHIDDLQTFSRTVAE